MAKAQSFYPPKINPFAAGILGALLPPVLKYYCCIQRIDVSDHDIARLRDLANGRLILSANHPSKTDPMIIGEMTRRSGAPFYFVSARENFENVFGGVLQAVGGYSIVRGAPDRQSMSMTRKLLSEDDARIVIFPEGDVYHHNEETLPFHSGVAQLAFWALGDMAKQGKDMRLPLLPAAVRYQFPGDIRRDVDRRLARLEKAVGVALVDTGYYGRCRAIGEKIIVSLEKQYRTSSDGLIPFRINRIKGAILDRVAGAIGVEVDASANLPDRVRAVFNALDTFAANDEPEHTQYNDHLADERADLIRRLTVDLWRVYNCMAVTGTYVTQRPTYERLAELVGRMEELVFGRSERHPPRVAFVKFGSPIELGDRYEAYKQDKRAMVQQTTADLEAAICGLLDDMRDLATPIPEDIWGMHEIPHIPAQAVSEDAG